MLFVCVAWLPKATVQAAVGGAALDLVREIGLSSEIHTVRYRRCVIHTARYMRLQVLENGLGDDARRHAETVLTLSVLVILFTFNPNPKPNLNPNPNPNANQVILLTAPLGAVGIAVAGPAWLSSDGHSDGHSDGPSESDGPPEEALPIELVDPALVVKSESV